MEGKRMGGKQGDHGYLEPPTPAFERQDLLLPLQEGAENRKKTKTSKRQNLLEKGGTWVCVLNTIY